MLESRVTDQNEVTTTDQHNFSVNILYHMPFELELYLLLKMYRKRFAACSRFISTLSSTYSDCGIIKNSLITSFLTDNEIIFNPKYRLVHYSKMVNNNKRLLLISISLHGIKKANSSIATGQWLNH